MERYRFGRVVVKVGSNVLTRAHKPFRPKYKSLDLISSIVFGVTAFRMRGRFSAFGPYLCKKIAGGSDTNVE